MIRPKLILNILFLAFLAIAANVIIASANSNQYPAMRGESSAIVSGVELINVHYTVNDQDPTVMDAVSFQLREQPVLASSMQIKIKLSPNSPWFPCTAGESGWNCPINGAVTVKDSVELRVFAGQ